MAWMTNQRTRPLFCSIRSPIRGCQMTSHSAWECHCQALDIFLHVVVYSRLRVMLAVSVLSYAVTCGQSYGPQASTAHALQPRAALNKTTVQDLRRRLSAEEKTGSQRVLGARNGAALGATAGLPRGAVPGARYWHTPVGYCRAEQSNRQAHPSRMRRLSHFLRSCGPRDQGEHTLST
jgi:hypothetical protein